MCVYVYVCESERERRREGGSDAPSRRFDSSRDEPIPRSAVRCRANMAHIRQSRPDSGLGFQVHVLTLFEVVPSSLGSVRGVGGGADVWGGWRLSPRTHLQVGILQDLPRSSIVHINIWSDLQSYMSRPFPSLNRIYQDLP